jgi:glutathione S-transferase
MAAPLRAHLVESGAIVLRIAEKSEVLMPSDAYGRARTRAWMFAALNSVEPPFMELGMLGHAHADEAWAAAAGRWWWRWGQKRLMALKEWRDGRDYLEDRFTAEDLLKTTVRHILRHTDIVSGRPALKRIKSAARRRPAFRRRWQITATHSRRRRLELCSV